MSYFIIYPKLLEFQPACAGRVQCLMTYSMEEYGLYQGLQICPFILEQSSRTGEEPLITVADLTLSAPIYAPFWRGFCLYLTQVLKVDIFNTSGPSATGQSRIFIRDVQFDPRKNAFRAPNLNVLRR